MPYSREQIERITTFLRENKNVDVLKLHKFLQEEFDIKWNLKDRMTYKHLEQIIDGTFWV